MTVPIRIATATSTTLDQDMSTNNNSDNRNSNNNHCNNNQNTNASFSQQQLHHQHHQQHQQHQIHQPVITVGGYRLEQKLGSGSFATVYRAVKGYTHSNTKANDTNAEPADEDKLEYVAIKRIDRSSNKITKKVLENLDLEISILTTYRHPNIVCLHEAHKSNEYFDLILEYCAGGDLQGLIRSRKSARLTEPLTRRLMRDLTAGLAFLAQQNLIHRDIKPQNLLLTGPLPLDELNDPARNQGEEDARVLKDFPTGKFHLKLADFGFARHLQKTSLAETLCGSPLYMAPEILQHRRYDNKADLWSTGTVLFEMIAGRPPFHGENHMDLLRNIQQKAVRLPPDLKISQECVKLLRILLNRNPLSRASFQDFTKASDAFVALGCNGEAVDVQDGDGNGLATATSGIGASLHPNLNLGPISEVEESHLVASTANVNHGPLGMGNTSTSSDVKIRGQAAQGRGTVCSSLHPAGTQVQMQHLHSHQQHSHAYNIHNQSRPNSHFAPLEPSPPGPTIMASPDGGFVPPMTLKPAHDIRSYAGTHHTHKRSDSTTTSQHSDDSSSGGFVMVEKGSTNNPNSPAGSVKMDERQFSRSPLSMWKQSSRRVVPASALSGNGSPPASPRSNSSRFFSSKTLLSTRTMIPPSIPFVRKGMLSTSPGTGGALVGMMGSTSNKAMTADRSKQSDSINFDSATKMIAAADDVGRRAINVAHVGDTRAYIAMRLILANESNVMQSSRMEGVEEEMEGLWGGDGFNRARAISADQSSSRFTHSNSEQEDDDDEMPFAMPLDDDQDPVPNLLAVKTSLSNQEEEDTQSVANSKSATQAKKSAILTHFSEALSCYMKALSMLKGSVNATHQILNELNRSVSDTSPSSTTESFLHFKNRCEVSHIWLNGQFKGVLERADAANSEIVKYTDGQESSTLDKVTSVEELIYNHSLACGKDGAVKQLLGQNENARSCYRSAGLLAETLLMEPKLVEEDKMTLEEYVSGFSDRINEIDCIMLQQSRHSVSSSSSIRGIRGTSVTSSRRESNSSVVPLVGGND